MSNRKYSVYCHTNRINGKRYVGITCVPVQRRWKNGLGYTENDHFYRAIQKYGWEEFLHEVLYTDLSKDEACEMEKYLIQKWNLTNPLCGYNNTLGGEHGLMSEHTKQKMSLSQRGEKAHWYGKKLSEETKRKMSLAKKGRLPSCSPKKPVIDLDTGFVYDGISDATKAFNISDALVHKICNHRYKREPKYHFEYFGREHGKTD